jgi:hypothetical protein
MPGGTLPAVSGEKEGQAVKTAQWIFIALFCVSAVAGVLAPFTQLAEIELAGIACLLLAIFCRLPGGRDE